jgi:5-methylcytosine-specific restriction endonuclease McrA
VIRLNKGPLPSVLRRHATRWKDEYRHRVIEGDESVAKAAETRYRDPEIKQAVLVEANEKCIYCESKPRHVSPGDVEHLLPKSRFPEFIVEWDNLGFVCSECNRRKGDYFDENEPIVNPFAEDPESFLLFAGAIVAERPGSRRGIVTIKGLGLGRGELVERRTELLRRAQSLINTWAGMPEGPAREAVAGEIRAMGSDSSEYAAAARSYLRLTGPDAMTHDERLTATD